MKPNGGKKHVMVVTRQGDELIFVRSMFFKQLLPVPLIIEVEDNSNLPCLD